MEWYHVWNAGYINHKQEHDLGVIEPEECLACEICNPIEREVSAAFKKFWDVLFKFEDTILMYNNVTHKELLNLLSMDNREREDTIHKGKCRNIVDRIIESIRYRQQPKMKEKGLRIIIVVIVRDCIEGNLENEVFDRLIGCPEIMEHGYILEDWDIENRFQKFWEWYGSILEFGVEVIHATPETIVIFRELLYMEEIITENIGKVIDLTNTIVYRNPLREGESKQQEWERLIQKVLQRFIDTKQFTREPEDPESDSPESYELEDSDGSIHYEIKIEDDVKWTVESLKRKIEEMGGRYIFRINGTKNRKLPDMIADIGQCKNCEQEEKPRITNGELLRLISMGYTDGEILDQEFIEIFQGNKNEMEKNLRRILDKFLKQQAGIEDSESSGNESDNEKSDGSEKESDGSGKDGEILNPNDTDNNENFEEPYEENIINRPGFDSSESSESNPEDKSEISDYNIENLFETPLTPPIPPILPIVPIIIGATRAEVREDFRAALLAATGHDIGGNWAGLVAANPLANAIEDAGNVAGGIISMPQFYGREEEDINDWVRQFETAFTAIGKAAGVNGARQAAMAATCLKGAAAQWYNEKKEANNGHLVNWQDNDNDNDLKHRIKQRFTREDVRKRKMLELRKITQGVNENVEAYTIRFRQILRIATRGHALDDELQVDNYIEGLTPTLGYQVRRQNPANLNDAVNTARREEEATNELMRKTLNIPINTQRKGIDIQDDKPKNIFEKPLEKNYEDDLADMFKKLEVKLVNQLGGQKRPPNNNNRQGPPPRACYNCKQPGHYANECRVNNGQRNYGRPNNQNYNRRSNNYNGRPNNYNRPPNHQNNNRGFNVVEYDNYNDQYDQYDYDSQDYQDNYDQGYSYDDPYYQDNDVTFNHVDQDFYIGERQTRSNIKNRSSNRDIDMEIDQEQTRRRNNKYASQEERAAALPKRGFTDESLRKAQEARRNNNTCRNCGQRGHYAKQCKNERVEGIHRTSAFQRNIPEYNIIEDLKNTRANATFSQIINMSPEQRKIYYEGMRRGKLIINQELKDVMFDTGAAVNVITSQIMDEMDLKIEEPSTVRCVMINEDKLASRGTTTIYIQFGDKEIPIKVEVIDSGKNEIVLGNGVLDMFKANIDYTDKTIIIRMNDETMDIPVKYTQRTIKGFEETFDEEEILEELYQDELYNIYEDDHEGDITNEQKGKLKVLVEKYKDIFEYDGEKYNRTNLVKHEIRLKGGTEPLAQKRYKENDEKGKFIRKEVDEMLKLGKIRESRSPWSSPVTLAGKKSGNYRFCIDYRKLNKVTITDAYPLPRIDEQLERISSGKWFTSLDLASGFNQIEMAEEDIEKTAFICSAGLYEYNVMPFGLTNAPANHLKHIKLVLEKLKEASLILKLKKCIFGKTEIEFLGHVVGKNGLKPSPGKVEKIQKLTAPINIKGVRSILGLCTYYRKFIKDFSKIVKPITSLLRKDEKFEWGIKQHEALEILKRKLTEEPVGSVSSKR
ncbi:hypothetical protein GLOIN_2v1765994 [Rhizophagus irregularis DAOM 181602=DAOM 197198]|nr:hypothetical protein GLOIN_2v1765994 [Rhizophagus irregularis DAOM 181602=DAOM 197198]